MSYFVQILSFLKGNESVYELLSLLQLGGPENVAEMTGRRGMLIRTSGGKGVIYQARST